MADGIYVGMAAASARAQQLESIADNLANAESPGFKAERPAFASFLPSGRSDKVFSAPVGSGVDLRPGTINTTDGPMDLVPEGDLFLGVETASGQIAYTRNGQLEVGPDGRVLAAGHAVLSKGGGAITVPAGSAPSLDAHGNILVDGAVVDTLGLYRIQGAVNRSGSSLLTPAAGTTVQAVDGSIRVGELEMGNAPALESAVAMISAQRQFETAMQAIQTYRQLDQRANEVGRIR